MTACACRTEKQVGVPVVICGPSLLNTYQTLQADFEQPLCFSSDLPRGMQAAETFAPSVLLAEEEALKTIDLGAIRVRLALGQSVRLLISILRTPEAKLPELLRSGVAGFLDRGASADIIRRAVHHVALGEIWASRKLISEALRTMASVIDDPRFTRREVEILRRLAAGEDNRQIAESLYITRETVRWHLRSAYAKLGVHNRNAAASLVRSAG